MEKEITTPEYYPLTLNALVNACNQKSNRDPVVNYDDESVREALERLRHRRLTVEISGPGMRVNKYGHRISDVWNLGRREIAVLCTLLLRGRQTLGEIRGSAERMFPFSDLEQVESVLQTLVEWPSGALVQKLPRLPGTKEGRYAHLLSGPIDGSAEETAAPAPAHEPRQDRISALEQQVASLQEQLNALRAEWTAFRQQFE